MSKRTVKWGDAERYFRRHGYKIRTQGGDKIIIAPRDHDPRRKRQTVRLGHRFCTRRGDELLPCHLARIKYAFGVTADDILADR
jgi:hypothetical protein